jgi:hypothetical protein
MCDARIVHAANRGVAQIFDEATPKEMGIDRIEAV